MHNNNLPPGFITAVLLGILATATLWVVAVVALTVTSGLVDRVLP